METRHLKIFVSVYKNRSFTKAADQLYTSQPTISEHIRNLEGRLDCKLFDRMGRSILPTAEADMLYPRALAILEDLKKLEDDLTTVSKSVSGQIILAASTIPSAYILPKLVAEFNSKHPDVSFEIRTFDWAQVIEKITNNEILLGVTGARTDSPKLSFQTLVEDELVLAANMNKRINPRITPKTLLELPFILREEGSGTRKCMEDILAEKDISLSQLNICATFGSSTAVTEAIKANLGVSILSRLAIEDALQHKQVQLIDILNFSMKRFFYMVNSTRRSLPYHYQVFLNSLVNTS